MQGRGRFGLEGSVAEIRRKLKLIPAKDIPKRPRARIWLRPLEELGEKLLRCIKLQNKYVPGIDNWQLIEDEKPNKSSRPIRPENISKRQNG